MRRASLIMAMLLTACAEPQTVFKPVTVDVPVTVPCKAPFVQPPASALHDVMQEASLFEKTKAALIEIDRRRAYEAQLTAALAVCQ